MSFQIGSRVRAKADGLHPGLKGTILAISDWALGSSFRLKIHIDSILPYYTGSLRINEDIETGSPNWELDPYFESLPCRTCEAPNHIGIDICWRCRVIDPHRGII